MSEPTPPAAKMAAEKSRAARLWARFGWFIIIGVLVLALAPFAPQMLAGASRAQLRSGGPDLDFWFAQPFTIQIHVYAALLAFAIGLVILFRRKGTGMHKTLGWAWVIAMAATAISSLFIMELNRGAYSFIHLITGWTLIALPMGIFAIRNKKVLAHRRAMTGIFVGGLLIAGTLSFLPGRTLWTVFFG